MVADVTAAERAAAARAGAGVGQFRQQLALGAHVAVAGGTGFAAGWAAAGGVWRGDESKVRGEGEGRGTKREGEGRRVRRNPPLPPPHPPFLPLTAPHRRPHRSGRRPGGRAGPGRPAPFVCRPPRRAAVRRVARHPPRPRSVPPIPRPAGGRGRGGAVGDGGCGRGGAGEEGGGGQGRVERKGKGGETRALVCFCCFRGAFFNAAKRSSARGRSLPAESNERQTAPSARLRGGGVQKKTLTLPRAFHRAPFPPPSPHTPPMEWRPRTKRKRWARRGPTTNEVRMGGGGRRPPKMRGGRAARPPPRPRPRSLSKRS
jgi:hypothetical protein